MIIILTALFVYFNKKVILLTQACTQSRFGDNCVDDNARLLVLLCDT